MNSVDYDIIEEIVPKTAKPTSVTQPHPIRTALYNIIFSDDHAKLTTLLFDIGLISIICLNVVAIMLESMPSFIAVYEQELFYFEIFSIIVFTVEYIGRAWCIVDDPSFRYAKAVKGRLRYLITPMAIIDLLAVAPFYLSFLFAIDLRFLRVLRLIRIFKLARYSSAMSILLSVIRQETRAFAAALFVLALLLIVSASMIHFFEQEAQPGKFESIPHAMWWALITLTTVGYGDIVPVTPGGKVFGAFISVIGIGMVALPAGILASGFSEKLHARRRDYEALVRQALENGEFTRNEIRALQEKQLSSGLSDEDAREILRRLIAAQHNAPTQCPNCGHLLHREVHVGN